MSKFLGKNNSVNDFEFKTNILIESLCKLDFSSPYHKIDVERDGDTIAKITLNEEYSSMDEDFILYMKEVDPLEADGMIYEYKENGEDKGIVYLRMNPILDHLHEDVEENYVFLIDISNTMEGEKLEQAKDALQLCIRNLSKGDKFDIVAMGDTLKYFYDEGMAEFNADTLREASKYIDSLTAESDADIFEGIKYALENEGGHNTILLFTDDQVENEEEILEYVSEHLDDNRIFAFGIDSETNNYFLNKLAHQSFGKAEFINNGERIDDIVLKQFKRIQNPEVDDIEIDWGSLKIASTYPRTIEYMYDREPFSIFADVLGEVSGEIIIKGKVGNKDYIQTINLDNFNTEENAALLKKIWARKRMKSIELNMLAERGEIRESMRRKVVELSKNNGLISHETTFIFLELREEPVLGIQLRNIIPLKVNEISLADDEDNDDIEDTEVVGFIYKTHEDSQEECSKVMCDNEYLDRRYPREKLLRVIAKNQFADGAFVDYEDSTTEDKIETTSMVLLAFTVGNENIDIYVNQLNKSIEFLANSFAEENLNVRSNIVKMAILALNRSLEKNISKVKNTEKALYTINYLYKVLNEREDGSTIANNLIEYSFKKNLISLFTLGDDGTYINEKIVINDERNSIFNMAKLAVLKSIKRI